MPDINEQIRETQEIYAQLREAYQADSAGWSQIPPPGETDVITDNYSNTMRNLSHILPGGAANLRTRLLEEIYLRVGNQSEAVRIYQQRFGSVIFRDVAEYFERIKQAFASFETQAALDHFITTGHSAAGNFDTLFTNPYERALQKVWQHLRERHAALASCTLDYQKAELYSQDIVGIYIYNILEIEGIGLEPSESSFRSYGYEPVCGGCERVISETSLRVTIGPISFCESCTEYWGRCHNCGDLTCESTGGRWTDNVESWVCRRCRLNCRECRARLTRESAYEHNEYNYCRDCHAQVSVILNHSTNVLDYYPFFGQPKDGIWYGVELEVETTRSANNSQRIALAKQVSEAMDGFAIVKHDGSLENGFEIVTAPATMEIHAEKWQKFMNLGLPLESWDTGRCGMHVHFSRGPVKPSHLARLMVFTYANGNRAMIETIAGRSLSDTWGRRYAEITSNWKLTNFAGVIDHQSGGWAGQSYRRENYFDDSGRARSRTILLPPKIVSLKRESKEMGRKMANPNRYTALNDCNDNTLELRIFRGTMGYRAFMKNMEYTRASLEFCRPGRVSFKDLENPNAFCQYVASEGKEFPYLKRFLQKFSYLPRKNIVKT